MNGASGDYRCLWLNGDKVTTGHTFAASSSSSKRSPRLIPFFFLLPSFFFLSLDSDGPPPPLVRQSHPLPAATSDRATHQPPISPPSHRLASLPYRLRPPVRPSIVAFSTPSNSDVLYSWHRPPVILSQPGRRRSHRLASLPDDPPSPSGRRRPISPSKIAGYGPILQP